MDWRVKTTPQRFAAAVLMRPGAIVGTLWVRRPGNRRDGERVSGYRLRGGRVRSRAGSRGSAAQVSSGALETNPAGQALACRHGQDLNHSRLTIGQVGAASLPGAHQEREC